jgi:hypothetical protein
VSDALNPVELEQQILDMKNRCYTGAKILKEKNAEFLDSKTAYEKIKSQAFMDHDGPQTEKRHAATLAAYEARKNLDRAQVEFEYTETLLKVCLADLMALQNLNRGVRTMYNAERGWGG